MAAYSTPPTKASLKAWWAGFTSSHKPKSPPTPFHPLSNNHGAVFGKPLAESLRYASVQISTANPNGELYVWGYIPVVVAKCGLLLKENATDIEGVFRVNGSARRMRELQLQFEAPPRYGKQIDWKKESYTPHDVASVFRRYLTQMPEPVIPHDLYFAFRDTLQQHENEPDKVVAIYKQLIRSMPQPNQYLLLYVLDLLNVFAKKSDKNRMNAKNLAVIFRPGIISHPDHEMSPPEHGLSQRVLEFLIAQQDWLLLEVGPPDETIPQASSSTSALPSEMSTIRSSDMIDDESWNIVSSPNAGARGQKGTISRWRSLNKRRSSSPSTKSPLRSTTNMTPITHEDHHSLKAERRKTVDMSIPGRPLEDERKEDALSPVDEDTVLSAGVEAARGITRSKTLPYRSGSKRNANGMHNHGETLHNDPAEMEEIDIRGRRDGSSSTSTSAESKKARIGKKGLLRKGKRTSSSTSRPSSP